MQNESWRGRLREAVANNANYEDPEIKSLQNFLKQYSLQEYLEAMRDEVWQCGEVRELGGLIQAQDGTLTGKVAAVQLYWDYEDREEVTQTHFTSTASGQLGHSYQVITGRFEPIPGSMYIVFGVARITVATPGIWEPRLIPNGGYLNKFDLGDYFYSTSDTSRFSSSDRDVDWKYGGIDTTGNSQNIKYPQYPQNIRQFIEKKLLVLSNTTFLPSDLTRRIAKDQRKG